MRTTLLTTVLLSAHAPLLFAQEHGAAAAEAPRGIMDIGVNLMVYTLVIFGVTFFILKKYFYPMVLGMVESREKALEEAIEGAKRDREEAAKLLAEHKVKLDSARDEGQKMIADARAVSEKMRADLLEQTRKEQQELLERAKRDIAGEREKAIAQLRREAVELAIVGASKVIEQNLDSAKNREIVERYLSSVGTVEVTR